MLSLKGSTCTVCYYLLVNFISPQILCVYLVDQFVVENFAQGGVWWSFHGCIQQWPLAT